MAKTVNERQQAFKARMKAKGLKEMRNLWVPDGTQEIVKELASALQRAANTKRRGENQ